MIDFIRQTILPQYGFNSGNTTVNRLGNGHINETFLVADPSHKIVLQRINTQIFTTPEAVIQNAVKIGRHLLSKREQQEYSLHAVSPFATISGELFLDHGQQGFWRAIDYLDHSHTIEVVTSSEQAKVAAHAFGHFASALSDLSANTIIDVIPDFLNLPLRIAQLGEAVSRDVLGRAHLCQDWINLGLSQTALLEQLVKFEAELPMRICHNDTKINNMLFDKRDMSSMAIIDLDTCMKGYLMYDFGDMVRAFCSPEPEDSTHLENVFARPDIISAATTSYIESLSGIITPLEKRSLWFGIKAMSLMLGVRFLTDYLNGDVYFAIDHDTHNLDRAINQLTIFKSLLQQELQLSLLFC